MRMAVNPAKAPPAIPAVLWRLSTSLNERNRLVDKLELVAACATELTAGDHADITLFDTTLRRYIPLRSTQVFVHQGDPDIAARVRDTKRALLVPDLHMMDAQEDFAFFNRDIASYLAVPIMDGGRVDGVLVVFNREPRKYDQGEQEALEGLAALAGVALRQQRLGMGLEEARRILLKLSLTDPVTGLATRQQFDRMLEHEWERALSEGLSISLLQIEVDKVEINPHGAFGRNPARAADIAEAQPGPAAVPGHGGAAGGPIADGAPGAAAAGGADDFAAETERDSRILLAGLARILRAALYRDNDMIALLSDTRIAVILPDTDHSGALAIARRLRRDAAAGALGGEGPTYSLSIGISSFDTLQLQQGVFGTPERLFSNSALALEQVKHAGGNGMRLIELNE